MKWKFSAGLDRSQSIIFKTKWILSLVEQLGGEPENYIYCFIKDKHSIWKSTPLGLAKLRGHFFNVDMGVVCLSINSYKFHIYIFCHMWE